MSQSFKNKGNGEIVKDIAKVIIENKAYLSEIDGKIGDGDHGVNMAKGFSMAVDRLGDKEANFSEAMAVLSEVLMGEIGGSMGPLYGMMFESMSEVIDAEETISGESFGQMLRAGLDSIQEIGSAKLGDKTLLDSLIPAVDAFDQKLASTSDFSQSLEALGQAANHGRDNTIDLVAKIGRSSRLGERSRGVLDAGATSCALILNIMGVSIGKRLA